MKIDESVLDEKSSFKMLGLSCTSEFDWGFYIISIAKTATKKIGVLICCMKFLSPEFALYFCIFTILPSKEYCCQISASAPDSYLEMSGKLQKRICRTVGPILAASLEP